MARLKVGVLISGRGSNMAALIAACQDPAFPAEIVTVISNRPDAPGLAVAARDGIPARGIDHRGYDDRAAFDDALDAELRAAGVELVCLAGFMRLLTPGFVARWRHRMLNVHPSLLPAFRGLDTHRRAIEAGVRVTGCTVHFVDVEVDSGPILIQAVVPVMPDDDPERLADRVLAAEHLCYPHALRLVAEKRVRVTGGIARIDGPFATPDPAFPLVNPPLP